MRILVAFLFLLNINYLFGEEKITSQESSLLIPFFQTLLQNTEVGYVFYDQKPICVEGFSTNACVFEPSEWHKLSVAITAAKETLERPFFQNGNIIFLVDNKEENLIVINRKLFLKTIKDNIVLFQYVLGPTVTPDSLLTALLTQHPFMEVFNYDKVLIGIVLGYGVQNSLYASRLEELQEEVFAFDTPPFQSKANLCVNDLERNILLFFPTKTELKRLASSEAGRNKKNMPTITIGFTSANEEAEFLSNKIDLRSNKLSEEKPNFIFGCLETEKKLISSLEITQNKIQELLACFSLFEILKIINCEEFELESPNNLPFAKQKRDISLPIAKLLKSSLSSYENNYLSFFAQGLLEKRENLIDSKEPLLGFAEPLANMKLAKKNIEAADIFFTNLKKEKDVSPILTNLLYFRVLTKGSKPFLNDETEVVLDYEIYDHLGNCLEKQRNVKVDLLQTISGFAHGLRGIAIGETRALFIHPSLGYGVHTYLEKGTYLKAIVKLQEIVGKKEKLPELCPLSISFVCDEAFQQNCEEEHKKNLRYLGALRAEFLRKCSGIDIKKVSSIFLSLEKDVYLSQDESLAINQCFWLHYFGNDY